MFKAGDKVKRVKNFQSEFWKMRSIPGVEVYTVIESDADGIKLKDVANLLSVFNEENFALVEDSCDYTNLSAATDEALIAILNHAAEVRKELHKRHPTGVEIRFQGVWSTNRKMAEAYRLKPAFQTFKIKHWDVNFDGENMHIGCKVFPARILSTALRQLTAHGSCVNNVGVGDWKLQACRSGVSTDGYTITWEEADQILAALDKALKEHTR